MIWPSGERLCCRAPAPSNEMRLLRLLPGSELPTHGSGEQQRLLISQRELRKSWQLLWHSRSSRMQGFNIQSCWSTSLRLFCTLRLAWLFERVL